MKTFDKTILDLCEEVDAWKSEAEYWKEKYESEVRERNEETTQRLLDAKKGIANALMFAMSVRDDEHGNLVMAKEDRKELSDKWNV